MKKLWASVVLCLPVQAAIAKENSRERAASVNQGGDFSMHNLPTFLLAKSTSDKKPVSTNAADVTGDEPSGSTEAKASATPYKNRTYALIDLSSLVSVPLKINNGLGVALGREIDDKQFLEGKFTRYSDTPNNNGYYNLTSLTFALSYRRFIFHNIYLGGGLGAKTSKATSVNKNLNSNTIHSETEHQETLYRTQGFTVSVGKRRRLTQMIINWDFLEVYVPILLQKRDIRRDDDVSDSVYARRDDLYKKQMNKADIGVRFSLGISF